MFDRILVVDWSAANAPKTGKDAIWIADTGLEGEQHLCNCSTRHEATRRIAEAIREETCAGRRIFVGLDFAFGYPRDSAGLPGKGAWNDVWRHVHDAVEDDERNRTNRFEVASQLNEAFDGDGPFWAHPWQHAGRYPKLKPTRPDYAALGIREKRHVDALVPRAQPVWKLAYTGSVGSQTLTGIARLQQLREEFGDALAIWPFETGFADSLVAPAIVAEIYPSLWAADRSLHDIKDACQVATLARGFTTYRERGRFEDLLDGPRRQPAGVRETAMTYEGWMVGFADAPLPLAA